jgi:SAM-dependent methyltransferase
MRLANYTRQSRSIPRRLLREGKPHLLPLYGLMLTSDLGREGILHSGSFRFADHVYRARPSGRFGVGYLLDALLLRLPAARSMRSRYVHAREQIVAEVRRCAARPGAITVVSAPCGVARELVEASDGLAADPSLRSLHARVSFVGVDLDDEALAMSRRLAGVRAGFRFVQGDVFDRASYPERPEPDVIVSTGLADFLDDGEAKRFFATCRAALRPGGLLVTSAQRPQRVADYLMRELAELRPTYRDAQQISTVLDGAGLTGITAVPDRVGYQTLVTARAPTR